MKLLKVGDVAVRRNPWFYADARQTLATLESADLATRRHWTDTRLDKVLWTARRSTYGRRLHGGADLHRWPLLSKDQVQAAPHTFCNGSRVLTVKASTGGTTGAPLRLFRTLQSIVFEQATLDHLMHKLGADGRDARCAVLRTDAVKDPDDFSPPYWIHAGGGRRIVFSSSHLNGATIGAYADALASFAPDVMKAHPTSLEALCLLLERSGRTVHAPRVVCSSEVLQPHVWHTAERLLGCALLDFYGQAERVACAYATAPGEYRFLPGYGHVEFEHVGSEGEVNIYEVVGTPLWNLSMPLVRYRTGDLIRIPAAWGRSELEELSFGLRSFSGVLGRAGDILLTPEGVRVTGISHFQRDVPHVIRIQIIQESVRRVRILVLGSPQYSSRDQEQLMRNIRRKLPDSMRVDIELTESLERTERGKTPFVIHRAPVKLLLQQLRASEPDSATAVEVRS